MTYKKTGFMLLEVLVSIGMIATLLPVFCEGFIRYLQANQKLNLFMTAYCYNSYLFDTVYYDLSDIQQIISISQNSFKFLNQDNTIISYFISNGRLGRKAGNSPTTYIYNSKPEITSLMFSTSPSTSLLITYSDLQTQKITPFIDLL